MLGMRESESSSSLFEKLESTVEEEPVGEFGVADW